jgi:hypothetical protein
MMKTNRIGNDAVCPEEFEKTTDDLAEYLEYLARITPTTLPEWID